jgi:hypothetical protein
LKKANVVLSEHTPGAAPKEISRTLSNDIQPPKIKFNRKTSRQGGMISIRQECSNKTIKIAAV